MSATERRLIRRLKQRDERAFREMVNTYQKQVYTIIFRMLNNQHEAEDLAQEVFVTVFKSIDSFRGDSKFSTWLYRISINHCKNRFKYLSRRAYHSTHSFEEGKGTKTEIPLQGEISRPDHALEGHRLQKAISDAISTLDEEHRVLIVLRDIQGLSYDEIGEITGLVEGTVKSRLHRARLSLKEKLERHL